MNLSRINALVERANSLLVFLAAAFLVVTVGLVAANVLSRYVLNVSLTWSAELARYTMIWSALLAAAVLVNRQQHLTVDLLDRYLTARLRKAAQILIGLGSMTFFGVVLVSGCILIARTSGQVASSMEWLPTNVVYGIIPASAVFMLLGSIVVLMRVLYGAETDSSTLSTQSDAPE